MNPRFVLTLVALYVPYLWGVRTLWATADQAFVDARYSQHLAAGLGPRFNLDGEAVDGLSSLLWVLLGAWSEAMGAHALGVLPALSVMSGLGLLALALWTLEARLQVAPLPAALATLALATFPPLWAWSAAGLSTVPLAGALLALTTLLLWGDTPRWPSAVFAGLGVLLRPDGLVWVLCIVLGASWARRGQGRDASWRTPLAAAAGACLASGLMHGALFGAAVPATWVRWASPWPEGGMYLLRFGLVMGWPLLVVPASVWAWRQGRAELLPFVGVALGLPLGTVLTGGDTLPFFRILVPAAPFMAILCGVALGELSRRGRWPAAAVGLAAVLVGVLPSQGVELLADGVDLHGLEARILDTRDTRRRLKALEFSSNTELYEVPGDVKLRLLAHESDRWRAMGASTSGAVEVGRALGAEARIVSGMPGALAHGCGCTVYDLHARLQSAPVGPATPWPGHPVFFSKEAFIDRAPTVLSLQQVSGPRHAHRLELLAARIPRGPGARTWPEVVTLERPAGEEGRWVLLERLGDRRAVKAGWERFDTSQRVPQAPETGSTPAGRWRSAADGAKEIELLSQIGYVSGSMPAVERPTIDRYDPERALPGLNLIVSGHDTAATLTTMEGEVLHRWSRSFEEVWPEYPALHEWENSSFWRRVLLMPDGDLIVIFGGLGMARLDRESNVRWAVPNRAHHDLRLVGEELFTLTRTSDLRADFNSHRPVFEDFVTVLDPSTGEELRRLSVFGALMEGPGTDWRVAKDIRDPFHTNSIQILDGTGADRVPALTAGNLLVSMRNISTIAILEPSTGRAVWSHSGDLGLQHDPSVLPNGNILVFNNNREPPSAVVELDPSTHEILSTYTGTPEEPLYTPTCGTARRLPNGNTLVVESDPGRAFELDPAQEVVWAYNNPHRAGPNDRLVASLLQVERVDPAAVPWVSPPERP